MIMAQFSISNAIAQYRQEMGEGNEDEKSEEDNVGDIFDVIKTKNVDEYMLITKEGIYFINIKEIKRPGNSPSQFNFSFNHDECYFKGETVKGAFEYLPDKLLVVVNGS